MSSSPEFASTPRMEVATLSVANTARDGSGTLVPLITAGGTKGTLVSGVLFKAAAATTAGAIRIYLTKGGTTVLLDEVFVGAVTPSATVPTVRVLWTPPPRFVLPTGASLQAAPNNAETFKVTAFGGDL